MFDFHVRDIVTSPWPETGYDVIQASANLTTAINQQVLDVENGLMFGNYYWNLPGTLSQDAAQVCFTPSFVTY